MPLPPVPNAVKCEVHNLWDGQTCINDLWFVGPSAEPSSGDVALLADIVATWYIGDVLPNLGESVVFQKVRAKSMAVVDGVIFDQFGTGETGGVGSETVCNNVNPCVTFRSVVGGRSGHGRNYIPGLPNADVVGNTIQSAWIGSLTSAYAFLLPGGTADPAPFIWSVVSYFGAGAQRVTPLSWPMASIGFTDNIVDSQRRRLPGRGK